MRHRFGAAAGVLGLAAITAACANPGASTGVAANGPVQALPAAGYPAAQAASPVPAAQAVPTQWVINCGPDQQAEIRQSVRDGAPLAEVTCVDRDPRLSRAQAPAGYGAPATAQPAFTRVSDEIVSLDDEVAVRPRRTVRTTPAVYRTEAPERVVERKSGRSWQKSAVIIGSSAGVGAGVGAAIGGKKGALIGAAVGGGGAAIWDQATRRKP
jgi:hypothetical protein